MKKLQTVLFAVLAVFAFGALMAATASAEETLPAEWLWNGGPVTELLSTTTTGGLTLRDTKTLAGAAAVLCKATVDGSVGPNGEDETTEILNANGEPVGELGGLALVGTGKGTECETVETCAEGTAASPIEVWPIGLPWHTELFLMENGEILDLITSGTGLVGYELLCLVLGIHVEDTCTSEKFDFPVINDPVSGDAAIPSGAETTPLAFCSQSLELSGLNIADATTLFEPLSGLLTVSSE